MGSRVLGPSLHGGDGVSRKDQRWHEMQDSLQPNLLQCETQLYKSRHVGLSTRVGLCYQNCLQKSKKRGKVSFVLAFQTSIWMNFREEYHVCDFPCVLSSAGGYLGLFFGVSVFDLIFTSEWIMKCLISRRK